VNKSMLPPYSGV